MKEHHKPSDVLTGLDSTSQRVITTFLSTAFASEQAALTLRMKGAEFVALATKTFAIDEAKAKLCLERMKEYGLVELSEQGIIAVTAKGLLYGMAFTITESISLDYNNGTEIEICRLRTPEDLIAAVSETDPAEVAVALRDAMGIKMH